MRAPIPLSEHERLQALHDLRVLDTVADARYDDIVRLAANVCQVPMAAITLIDADRQWSKAQLGFDSRQASRDAAFCAHTILGDEVMVVPDALDDVRFDDHESVIGPPRVRFYAGAPLLTADGHALGALCVLDRVTRTLEQWQTEALEALARQAISLMRLDALADDHARALEDLELARRKLAFLATHDALTGLLNRQALTGALGSLAPANRAGTVSSALLIIDLDNFKDINDTLGHEAGDRVLVSIGDRIHLGARGDDTVVRLAGDQFVVLIPNAGTLGPESLARRLLQSIAVPVEFHGTTVAVTASIGIARWDERVQSVDDLMRHADAAMLDAKSDGRNRYAAFEERVANELTRRLDTHGFVRHVVNERLMRLDFQPLWSLTNGTVIAHEALLRWDTASGPTVDPASFVVAAEEIGLVGEITRFTIHEACRLAARRRTAGEANAAVTVNLSSVQLDRDEVILVVATALNDSGLDPSALILELTESAKLAESGSGQATLRELQNMGVRIALDDFGTGFSSLALLRSFPFDFMKIDRTFVSAGTDADRDVLRSLVQLGHSLGMMVVAEGSEDPDVLDQLRQLGCDVAQGYLLGRPGSADPPHNMASHPLIPSVSPQD
jgi:diguanylate cyclase (GGDEF)-like protein